MGTIRQLRKKNRLKEVFTEREWVHLHDVIDDDPTPIEGVVGFQPFIHQLRNTIEDFVFGHDEQQLDEAGRKHVHDVSFVLASLYQMALRDAARGTGPAFPFAPSY